MTAATATATTATATAAAVPAVAARTDVRERTGGQDDRALAFADFHTHTRASRDSLLSEERFVRLAVERGLTHVAVTNHNNVEGALAVRETAARLGMDDRLNVILGEEVSSADGEIIGLFVDRTIPRDLSADETSDAIHEQGGLVSIPHPYDPFRRSHIHEPALIGLLEAGKVDAIEVFNSRVTFYRHNLAAAELAARYRVPGIAASDSHSGLEVAMSFNVLPAFRSAAELKAVLPAVEWHGSRTTKLVHVTTRYAVWSKALRRRMRRPDR